MHRREFLRGKNESKKKKKTEEKKTEEKKKKIEEKKKKKVEEDEQEGNETEKCSEDRIVFDISLCYVSKIEMKKKRKKKEEGEFLFFFYFFFFLLSVSPQKEKRRKLESWSSVRTPQIGVVSLLFFLLFIGRNKPWKREIVSKEGEQVEAERKSLSC